MSRATEAHIARCLKHEPFANPNPKRHRIQDSFWRSRARRRVLRTGNRFGKTQAGAREAVAHFVGFDPLDPERKIRVPNKGWIITNGKLVHNIISKLHYFMPPGTMAAEKLGIGDWYWRSNIGCEMWIKTHGQERAAFQAEDLDWLWPDEEMPEFIYPEVRMRLVDRQGIEWWTLTALEGSTWLYELFDCYPKECLEAQSGFFAWFTGGLMDNPYIPEAVREQEVRELERLFRGQPDQIRIRLHGDHLLLGGSPLFDPEFLEKQYTHRRDPVFIGDMRQTGIPGHPFELVDDPAGRLVLFELPRPGCDYAIGADVAMGLKDGDFSCAWILNRDTQAQAGIWHGHIDPYEFGVLLTRLGYYFNTALLIPEVMYPGNTSVTAIRHQRYGRIFRRQHARGEIQETIQALGVITSAATKPMEVEQLRHAIAQDEIDIYDTETLDELRRFRKLSRYKRELPSGYYGYGAISGHDDRVMALCHTWYGHLTSVRHKAIRDAPSSPQEARIMADLKRMGFRDPRRVMGIGP